VTLRARWVTLRARWVTLRARWVALRARWVTLRARWVTRRARLGDVKSSLGEAKLRVGALQCVALDAAARTVAVGAVAPWTVAQVTATAVRVFVVHPPTAPHPSSSSTTPPVVWLSSASHPISVAAVGALTVLVSSAAEKSLVLLTWQPPGHDNPRGALVEMARVTLDAQLSCLALPLLPPLAPSPPSPPSAPSPSPSPSSAHHPIATPGASSAPTTPAAAAAAADPSDASVHDTAAPPSCNPSPRLCVVGTYGPAVTVLDLDPARPLQVPPLLNFKRPIEIPIAFFLSPITAAACAVTGLLGLQVRPFTASVHSSLANLNLPGERRACSMH
jgi:hypothetical protein